MIHLCDINLFASKRSSFMELGRVEAEVEGVSNHISLPFVFSGFSWLACCCSSRWDIVTKINASDVVFFKFLFHSWNWDDGAANKRERKIQNIIFCFESIFLVFCLLWSCWCWLLKLRGITTNLLNNVSRMNTFTFLLASATVSLAQSVTLLEIDFQLQKPVTWSLIIAYLKFQKKLKQRRMSFTFWLL